MPPILSFLILCTFVILFGLALVYLTSKLGPKPSRNSIKDAPYECGMEPVDRPRKQISVNFYLTAILFVLFDVEIIFLFPWALAYKDLISEGLGLYAFVSMMIFLTLFLLGLFWEIKSKALDWK